MGPGRGAAAAGGAAARGLSGAPRSIRRAGLGDVDELAKVHASSARAAWSELLPAELLARFGSTERRRAQWRERLGAPPPGTLNLVVEVAGRVGGLVAVGPTRDEDCDPAAVGEVAALYVDPAHWGRGIGRALLDEGVECLQRDGFSSATLWTLATGARTRRFYERAGWRPEGAERPLDKRSGVFEVRYERSLTQTG